MVREGRIDGIVAAIGAEFSDQGGFHSGKLLELETRVVASLGGSGREEKTLAPTPQRSYRIQWLGPVCVFSTKQGICLNGNSPYVGEECPGVKGVVRGCHCYLDMPR